MNEVTKILQIIPADGWSEHYKHERNEAAANALFVLPWSKLRKAEKNGRKSG